MLSKTTATRHKLGGIRVSIIRTSLERTTRRRRCIATKLGRVHKSGIRHTIQQQKILVPIQREFGGIHGKVVPGDKSTITCRHGRVRKGNSFVVVVYRLHRVGSGLRHKIESACVLALQHTLEFGAPTSAVDAKGVLYIDPSTCCST